MMRREWTSILLVVLLGLGIWPTNAYTAGPTTVAVFPFSNVTGDDTLGWLRHGIAATLTTKLTGVQALRMVERAEIDAAIKEIAFGQTGLVDPNTAARAGQLISAQVLVVGEYQKAGEQLRLSARFVNVESGAVIQTAESTGSLGDIFRLQDKLALDLIIVLQLRLTEAEQKQVMANPTVSLPAYTSYYQGFEMQQARGQEVAAEAHYRNAIRHDAKFGDAYLGLGQVLMIKGLAQEAGHAFQQAAKLQPYQAEPLMGLAQVYAVQNRPQDAVDALQKAVQLQPNDPRIHFQYANTLQNMDPTRAAQAWQAYMQIAQPLLSEKVRLPQAQQQLQVLLKANPQLSQPVKKPGGPGQPVKPPDVHLPAIVKPSPYVKPPVDIKPPPDIKLPTDIKLPLPTPLPSK